MRVASWKQSGQQEVLLIETTSTLSRSSTTWVVAISNPGGRGRKGDEDMVSGTPDENSLVSTS